MEGMQPTFTSPHWRHPHQEAPPTSAPRIERGYDAPRNTLPELGKLKDDGPAQHRSLNGSTLSVDPYHKGSVSSEPLHKLSISSEPGRQLSISSEPSHHKSSISSVFSSDLHHKASISSTVSSPSTPSMMTSPHSGHPAGNAYNHITSNPNSAIGAAPTLPSPSVSRRASEGEREPRQSLPSIHEALGKEQSPFFSQTSQPPQPPQLHTPSHPMHSTVGGPNASPTAAADRFHSESGPYSATNRYSPQAAMSPASRSDTHVEDSRSHLAKLGGYESAPVSARPGHGIPTPTSSISSFNHQPPQPPPPQAMSTGSPTSAPGYRPYQPQQPAFSYPPPNTHSSYQYQASSYGTSYARSDGSDDRREEERKPSLKRPMKTEPYSEPVKRHFEIYDIATALNEIAGSGGRSVEFSRKYGDRVHGMTRSGLNIHQLPNVDECDEMIRLHQNTLASLNRMRDIVATHQRAMAEQRSHDESSKGIFKGSDSGSSHRTDKSEGSGGFAGSDPKKRRGRNAPPGRCHSCNRAETPEWRRGPDGARTLCNACGLHYAKVKRKEGAKANLAMSNLRPKESR